jgi:cyclic pyranopterin phosphate synthase
LISTLETQLPIAPDVSEPDKAAASRVDVCVDTLRRPLKDLRLSVIDQCNFRCTYCMPKEVFTTDFPFLPSSSWLSVDQMSSLASALVNLGVEKIRITGGEPLLRKNLETLVERLARLRTPAGNEIDIALTTNGSLLATRARSLRDAGLQRITVSLDSLDDATFQRMNGVSFPVAKVLDGIEASAKVGLSPIKVNMVVEKGINDGQILPVVRYFRHSDIAVRFIEFMDVGGADSWNWQRVITGAQMRALIESEYPLVSVTSGRQSNTAENFRYCDGAGEIGFISSISHPFCGDCTRVRISADGKMFLCLFATRAVDLKPWLTPSRSPAELAAIIREHWRARDDRYSELRSSAAPSSRGKAYPTVRMSLVGG